VEVLDDEQDRPPLGAAQDEPAERLERSRLDRRGRERGERLRAVRDAEEAKHVREDPGGLDPHLPDALLDLLRDHLRAVALGEPEAGTQNIEDREVRDGAGVGLAPPFQERHPLLGLAEQLLAEFLEQPRFPYAGLAEETVEKGYRAVTVADIVRRAGIARNTFYENFSSKEDCFLAASEFAVKEALRRVVDAASKVDTWPARVNAGLAAFLHYVASEPALARTCIVEALSAGPAAVDRYERSIQAFVPLFRRTNFDVSTGDFTTRAWAKLCINAPGAISAILMKPTGVIEVDPIPELTRGIVRECLAVGRAEGAVLDEAIIEQVVEGARRAPADSINSLLADRMAGRPMEIDARNGAVVRFGRRHGIPTPLNEMAVALLVAAQDARRY